MAPMLSDEEAKAMQEAARLGQKGLELADNAGGYLAGTFQGAIKYLAMAAEDSAAGMFIRNRARVLHKTKAYLAELGVDKDFRPIAERNAVPLLEAISLESDESLQDVWAAYISNAMDPTKPAVTVNRQLIELIKRLEPADLPVLQRLSYEDLSQPRRKAIRLTAQDFSVSDDLLFASLTRLAALGLFAFENSGTVGWAESEDWRKPCQLEVVTSIGDFRAQPLLLVFQRSVQTNQIRTALAEGNDGA